MTRLISLTIAALVLAGAPALAEDPAPQVRQTQGYTPKPPKDGFKYPECFCTDSGGKRVEIGQTACLQIGSRQVMARCGMSLNNPAWRHLSTDCPTS